MVTPLRPEDRRGRIGRITGRLAGEVTGRVMDTVDPNPVLDHVDVDAVLDRVDVNAVLDRVDVDRLLARVDVDALLDRVDLEALVKRSGVPDVIAASTHRFAGSAVDSARRQLVSLDLLVGRLVDGVLRRRQLLWTHAPVALRPSAPRVRDGCLDVSGGYAGPVTRLTAVIVDSWVLTIGSTLALAGADYLSRTLLRKPLDIQQSGTWWVVGFSALAFLYSFLSLQIAGQTPGKALMGLRVTRWDGSPLTWFPSLLRTLLWPLSLLLAGMGAAVLVAQRDHRALHDLLARTAVVYDWGTRPAEIGRALSRTVLRT